MSNLIRAELYRIRQRRIVLGLLIGLLVLLPLLLVLVQGLEFGDMIRVEAQALPKILEGVLGVGPFFAIPCAVLAFSDQYGHNTLINEAVFGVPRLHMYLSRLAAAAVLGTFLAAVCFGCALVFALVFYADRLGTLYAMAELLPWLAGALPIWIASAAVCLCFEFVFRSDRTAVIFYIVYLTFGFIFIMAFGTDGLQEIAAGEAGLWAHLNVLMLQLHPMTPFFPVSFMNSGRGLLFPPVFLDGSWIAAGRCWLLGLAITAVSALLAWLVLRRRELR